MLRIEAKSKLTVDEVVKRAVQYFGPEGQGLKVTDQGPTAVRFEGGGGGVVVTIHPEKKGTSVEVSSREWDYQAKEFMRELRR